MLDILWYILYCFSFIKYKLLYFIFKVIVLERACSWGIKVLGPGPLGRAKAIGLRGRWEGGLGWGTHVNPWLIHVNAWQKPLQYCKVISLQLIKINEKKNSANSYLVVTAVTLFIFSVIIEMLRSKSAILLFSDVCFCFILFSYFSTF